MSRKRRTREEKQTVITITKEEFNYIIGFFNSLNRNLENTIRKELGYEIDSIYSSSTPSKYSKINKSVLLGNELLNNTITVKFANAYYTPDVVNIFKTFAKNNRYINITDTDTSIRIENSDKYQYFNIIIKFETHNVIKVNIYARRLFTANEKKHKNSFLRLF